MYFSQLMFVLILGIIVPSYTVEGVLQCKLPKADIPRDWITMVDPCTKRMKDQVQEELKAAMTYLAMGAHFSRDTVNRPGFAKYFFESASEERQHAIKIIGYLLMRGGLTEDINQLIRDPQPIQDIWADGISAFKDALKLEAHVTSKLREIATVCEDPGSESGHFNDYHLVDWVSSDFLDEQYKAMRDLAGKVSELGKMIDTHGAALAEFLYDKKMLNGEPVPFF